MTISVSRFIAKIELFSAQIAARGALILYFELFKVCTAFSTYSALFTLF